MFLLPEPGTIFWVSIIFGVSIYILGKYAWKPIIGIINERENAIEAAMNEAKEVQTEIQKLKTEQNKISTQAKLEKERLIREGNEQRELIINNAIKKAEIETDKILNDARIIVAREKEAALLEMKTQIATLSVEIATKVIHAEMQDKERHQKMVETLVNEIEVN